MKKSHFFIVISLVLILFVMTGFMLYQQVLLSAAAEQHCSTVGQETAKSAGQWSPQDSQNCIQTYKATH